MSSAPLLDYIKGHRDGFTYSPEIDFSRLNRQAKVVADLMSDQRWRTLREIADRTGEPEASISARLRDFRKPKFTAAQVDRRRRSEGTWEYRVIFRGAQ